MFQTTLSGAPDTNPASVLGVSERRVETGSTSWEQSQKKIYCEPQKGVLLKQKGNLLLFLSICLKDADLTTEKKPASLLLSNSAERSPDTSIGDISTNVFCTAVFKHHRNGRWHCSCLPTLSWAKTKSSQPLLPLLRPGTLGRSVVPEPVGTA